jgi:Ca-activated chloride channel family protein
MVISVLRHRRANRVGWIVVGVVGTALVLGAGAAGYVRYTQNGCSGGSSRLSVLASPDQSGVMSQLAEEWSATKPVVNGRCFTVAVRARPSDAVASSLGPTWDEQRDGPRPDVWVPDSSTWLLIAASRPDGASVLPTGAPPSLATSPVVLAMQRPMAEALGWPGHDLGWSELIGAFSGGKTWAQFGHADWGPLRLGMVDPTRDTAGLVAALTILDPNNDSILSNQELFGGLSMSQMVTSSANDTATLLKPYTLATAAQQATTTLPAGFPIVERDLAQYAATKPAVPLVPVYPKEGTGYADYPYTVLRASWVDKSRQQAAAKFLDFLQGTNAVQKFEAAGFRDPARTTQDTGLLAPALGFQLNIPVQQRTATAEGLTQLLSTWTVLQRPNNALLMMDVSGSMNDPVPGTSQTRLQLVQNAAMEGASLLNNQTTVGLWAFSTKLTPATDYRELVPPGLASDQLGPVTRRQAVIGAVQGLHAGGGTGLYNTIYAGYLRMQQAWQSNAANVLVVMTDGKNEDAPGLDLGQLETKLRAAIRPDRPLPIVGIAVGPQADAGALQEVAKLTGGRTFVARDDVSAIQQIVLAFAGRVS